MNSWIGNRPLEAYVLLVDPYRCDPLLSAVGDGHREISEAVPRFSVGRNPLIVFVSFAQRKLTHFAEGRRGAFAATGSVRLHLRGLQELTRPISFTELHHAAPARVRNYLRGYLESGGVLPPKTGDALIDIMAEFDERLLTHLFVRYTESDWINDFEPNARRNLGRQKDALTVAFHVAGIETRDLVHWHPGPASHGGRFFLEGLPNIKSREEDMLLADLEVLPGFDELHKTSPAIAHFQGTRNPLNRMTVIMANNRPLERQTGVDLVYFNETYRSFVMVQYKAMETENGERRYRWRDGGQLMREIQRMRSLWEHLNANPAETAPRDFRLSDNPFFLKFCPRESFRPDTTGMYPGMYLPLDFWDSLRDAGKLKGPRGGNLLTYANAGRWLSNTEFIHLVSRSWVGTSAAQSDILQTLIRRIVATGRTVVYAAKRAPHGGSLLE